MFSIFKQAIKFNGLFLAIFKSFCKLTLPLNKRFERCFKRAFNPNFEQLRKNHKKYVYQHDPTAILATHQVKKV